ncbi:KR domain-containing protein [Mesorhizobium sp. AR10]|uniref:type I polyketide synthase n=1 Tax=Mesorhizobium sp. AR10 TaxID=2865839 RepID=UPI002160E8FA|nr:type I polyketide synthase [Mesorhizobium sp. AR10]UVK40221.1 KR domain-containing protein [Mesorhizobium sp. AR10]
MLNNTDGNGPNDIAIVGMALRVPGARTVDEFWNNLRSGTESIRTLSAEELAAAGERAERIHHPHYVPRTAELPDMEMFDAEFFGLSPKEAAIMDPQHRQFLECAWEAIEDAGRVPETASGPIGVFAGCGMGSYFYFNVCANRTLVDQVGMFLLRHTGNDKDFLATRASFMFDLCGPSVNVQTACSTSLVAVHFACQSLLNGECDMALAGGVTIELPHRRGYLYQEGEILSPDGHCRAFDHRAGGTVFGSGVGVVALRRLADALEQGDQIHAVIKATAINNDGGSKASYLAPSVGGQAAAIVEAQALAGISADMIQYVECHGTGTALGDPIEIEALTQAFRQSTDRRSFCHIGSVKSNIGHLDTAAGVVSLIKTALAIKHGEIPPTLGFERPNPAINFASNPFVVCSELTKWPQIEGRRRAAVNSLGVGGTNAHAILEQSPYRSSGEPSSGGPVLLALSARQQSTLERSATTLSHWLQTNPEIPIGDVAYTLWAGRKRFEHNRLIAVRDRENAIAALAESQRSISQRKLEADADADAGAVFLFPGGGVQHKKMAADLYRLDAFFRATVDEGLAYLADDAAGEIREAWFGDQDPSGNVDPFLKPSVQLPAILIVEVAIARLWMRAGVKPSALIGHSMGENAAACIAGVFDFRDAVRLVRLRGELFDAVPRGGMLSVPLSGDDLRAILPDTLDIAALNAPGLSVVSGPDNLLESFAATLEARDISPSRIPIDIAAHSRMLDAILPRWEAFLRSLTLRAPKLPVVSNLTGEWLTNEQATDPIYWVRHLRSTVLFAEGMSKVTKSPGRVYIDVGPGKTLSSLAKAQGSLSGDQIINSLPHPGEACDDRLHFLSALGRAALCGLPVEHSLFWDGGPRQRQSLPTYSFQRNRYFIDPPKPTKATESEPEFVKEPDMVRWGYRPVWKQSLPDLDPGIEPTQRNWLVFLDDHGTGARLVDKLRKHGHEVTTVSCGDAFVRRSAADYVICPEHGLAGYGALLQSLASDDRLPSRLVHLWLLTPTKAARAGSNLFHRNQEHGFYSLLHLAQAFGEIEIKDQIHFTVVTDGMQRVAGEPLPHPEKATVLGPGLVIPREIPGATVRLIDIEAVAEAGPAWRRAFRKAHPGAFEVGVDELLWSDLVGEPASEVVAYRNAKRWTRSHGRLPLCHPAAGVDLVKQGGVYLFTGGLGGIATALAGDLARRFGAKSVLVGRTSLPPREKWQAYRHQNEPDQVRRGIETILDLEAGGAELMYLQADATNAESMAAAVADAIRCFGRLDGVFHTAGLVDDALMQMKSMERIEAVLAPKLLGTRVLDEVLRDIDIDFLVLFSSTSTITAPPGQADYVAANAYLDAYAESCAGLSRRKTIALHWGIWNEVGLAARGTGLQNRRRVETDTPANGPFHDRWVQDDSGDFWLEAEIGPQTHWMLDEHRLVSGEAILPGTAYFELIAQAAREHGLGDGLLLKNLVMLKPLVVPDGTTRVVQTALRRDGDGWRVTVRAGVPGVPASFAKHAEAALELHSGTPSLRLDIAAVRKRLAEPLVAADNTNLPSAQERHIRFGERWQVLRSTSFGPSEALAEVSLRPEHRADIVDGTLIHPALLDIATGFAMQLVETFGSSDVLWAPVSYGTAQFYGQLPERLFSHVSLVQSSDYGTDYAAFDIVISDENGNVVFVAERFLMKKLDGDSAFVETKSTSVAPASIEASRAPSAAMLKLASQVRQGILPTEGTDALLRALGSGQTQPIISSIDLATLCAGVSSVAIKAVETGTAFERPDVSSEFIAPRNSVEATLAGFWQDLLGVAKVGMDDSFFDLGGHSLIAVRLFRMIKKSFGVDLPISILFSAPTIAQCAQLIAEQAPTLRDGVELETAPTTATTRCVHLTTMHPGRNPDAVPLFICAGMFGNVLNLRYLALHLGADRPVYGLQARGLYGDMAPHEAFEDMAADYIAEIRTVRPRGPYLLAGYSGGGITAFEMARQLRESGEVVPHVIMLDTPQPTQPSLSRFDKLAMKSQDLRRSRLSYFKLWLKNRTEWRKEMRRKRKAEASPPAALAEQFDNDRIEAAFRRALSRYAVAPSDCPVTVFRPRPVVHYHLPGGRRLMANRNLVLDDNGWGVHVENVEILEVPGDHDTMVLEPNVRVLAEDMRRTIEQSLRSSSPLSASSGPTKVDVKHDAVPG